MSEFVSVPSIYAYVFVGIAFIVALLISNGAVSFTHGMTLIVNILMAIFLLSINARLGAATTKTKRSK